jgi:hypothetical protein
MRVGILILYRSGSSTLREKLGPSLLYGLCVWPLCGLGGSGGRRVPLALAVIDEVSVISKWERGRSPTVEDF